MLIRVQELLQQMLRASKPRSPAIPGGISPSESVTSHLSHTELPNPGVAAATVHPPISKQSKAQSGEKHSMLPLQASIAESHQGTPTAARGASTPTSLKKEQAAWSKEADAAEQQGVSLVTQPELYSALTAAVSAIVQQAGWPQSQPAANCLKGISLQYHARGQGAQLKGQDAQLGGQGAQLKGDGAQLGRQAPQAEGQPCQLPDQTDRVDMHHRCSEEVQAGHDGQHQDPCPSSSPEMSGTSPGHQVACQAQHAQHAQHSTAEANLPAGGQQAAHGDGRGGVADGSGPGLAWQVQVQIQQAVEVLQAALQTPGQVGVAPAVVTSR